MTALETQSVHFFFEFWKLFLFHWNWVSINTYVCVFDMVFYPTLYLYCFRKCMNQSWLKFCFRIFERKKSEFLERTKNFLTNMAPLLQFFKFGVLWFQFLAKFQFLFGRIRFWNKNLQHQNFYLLLLQFLKRNQRLIKFTYKK